MHTTTLRKVGGSVMLAVPPALLNQLDLQVGSVIGLDPDGDRFVVVPQQKPRYSLEELLSQCDPNAPNSEEDRKWISLESAGDEL